MDKREIIKAILSKDKDRIVEAKSAIKTLLDNKRDQFKIASSKFIAKSIFETKE